MRGINEFFGMSPHVKSLWKSGSNKITFHNRKEFNFLLNESKGLETVLYTRANIWSNEGDGKKGNTNRMQPGCSCCSIAWAFGDNLKTSKSTDGWLAVSGTVHVLQNKPMVQSPSEANHGREGKTNSTTGYKLLVLLGWLSKTFVVPWSYIHISHHRGRRALRKSMKNNQCHKN